MAAVERVLMTADTLGGVWTYALELARGLAEAGVETALATMGAPLSRDQTRQAGGIPRLEIWESRFRLEWMPEPWDDVRRAGDWLLAIEERFRPDIIHSNQYCFGGLPFSAPLLMVGHSCVLSWWRAVHGENAPAQWDRYRSEVAHGLRAASLVAAPTRAMLSALEEHYGPLPATRVLPNGRQIPKQATVPKQAFLFAAGRLWDEAKNLAALEEIASGLPWPVYVAGEVRAPDGTASTFRRCRPVGNLTPRQVAWWMDRASIFVSPARYEPFGLSILEAALAGCALVLGDIPSLRETWEGAAVFANPGDSEILRSVICGLIQGPEARLELARQARRRALEFGTRPMVNRYLEAYASLQHRALAAG